MELIHWLLFIYLVPLIYSFIKLVGWHAKMTKEYSLSKEEARLLNSIFSTEFKNSFIPILNIFNALKLSSKISKIEETLRFIYKNGDDLTSFLNDTFYNK